ncbi:hypothetical protein [Mesorhizobium australicum]|uniref:Uncharacterized protein n=1 Tax=Mesorhizobium australicum TaxID=536018 RepID=A0A1X7MQM8_9HYPH|nr:hypothetical protein [Mesorhizobium australicum]SMH26651.1 hypothetical protein SAMN02982922_0384 [Mesorhizobium australicum]
MEERAAHQAFLPCNGGRHLQASGFAAFVAFDLFSGKEHGGELASIVAASGLVYLAAAALEKPSASWLVFFGSVVVITVAKMGVISVDATWLLLAIAAAFLGYGVVHGTYRSAGGGLPLQTIAMIAFGAIAAIALYLDPTAGAYLVATGLFAHAVWDVYHHRVNKVVSRSMAEFCCVLDVALAGAIVIATASS